MSRNILFIYLVLISVFSVSIVHAETESSIPDWIKTNIEFWTDGQTTDQEFLSAIQYLIDNDILQTNESSKTLEKFEELKLKNKITIIENKKLENQLDSMTKKHSSLLEEQQKSLSLTDEILDEYEKLSDKHEILDDEFINYEKDVSELMQQEQSKPTTTIYNGTVTWTFQDSKQNRYEWVMPMDSFEEYVKFEPNKMFYYSEQDIPIEEFSPYVIGSFDQVIDDVYDNSLDNDDFIFELWYIVSQLTVYSLDIGEIPRYGIETLTRGGGDCEDTAILLADFLISSKYTKNWDIWLIDMDADNPSDLQKINHVIVAVDIDKSDELIDYFIETTTKDPYVAFENPDYENIDGYWFPVEKQI